MRKTAASVIAFATVSLGAPIAAAQCVTVDPVIVPQVRVDPLDASGAAELVQPLFVTFRRAAVDSQPLTVRYQIVDEDSSAIARVGLSQGPIVEWSSSDSSRDIGALRNESYALLRTGVVVLADGEPAVQRQVALRLSDLRADLPAGVYREQFTVRFWCEDAETGLAHDSMGAIAVSVAVPNVLSASVAGASMRGEIDFMDFEALTRSLQVSVRSTGPFRVTARSANGGVLLREGAAGTGGEADRIRYQAAFAGETLDIDGGAAQSLPRAGLTGRQIPLDVRVDDVSDNRAGSYADTLYLTLEPAN